MNSLLSMPIETIPFKDTNYFSQLICDYLEEKENLKPFYNRFPDLENFQLQIDEKAKNYDSNFRNVLVERLQEQCKDLKLSQLSKTNISSLKSNNTFTVTTGHQLNLFTGPLYFFYKIVSTINLCKFLKENHPDYDFVPIYWMASEDHDFEEINYFNFEGKKVRWKRDASGAVGELDLDGLDRVLEIFKAHLPKTDHAKALGTLFKTAYLQHENLTDATRFLVNELLGEFGLVILDGNDKELKKLFQPFMEMELFQQKSVENVTETNILLSELNASYKIQVHPRDINLFYIKENLRGRIVQLEENYVVEGSELSWSKVELKIHLEKYPERFSPNVILRPLYQEVILPNLCYIGGGGELAYWFQLKSNFETHKVTFPMLLLRNSVLLINKKQARKLEKLPVSIEDLFLKQSDLMTKVTKQISEIDIDFSPQKAHLKKQFEALFEVAKATDKSFIGAVSAQETKQIKGLENLEGRLLKAQKRKLENTLSRIRQLQDELFPNHSLQERFMNFSEFYLEFGDEFIHKLIDLLDPIDGTFSILRV